MCHAQKGLCAHAVGQKRRRRSPVWTWPVAPPSRSRALRRSKVARRVVRRAVLSPAEPPARAGTPSSAGAGTAASGGTRHRAPRLRVREPRPRRNHRPPVLPRCGSRVRARAGRGAPDDVSAGRVDHPELAVLLPRTHGAAGRPVRLGNGEDAGAVTRVMVRTGVRAVVRRESRQAAAASLGHRPCARERTPRRAAARPQRPTGRLTGLSGTINYQNRRTGKWSAVGEISPRLGQARLQDG